MMLNLKQLDDTIASMKRFVMERKNNDAQRMLKSNYRKSKNSNVKRDSVLLVESKGMYCNPDSLYATFDAEEQQRAVSNAVQYAREVRQRMQDDIHYYNAQDLSIIKSKLEWHRKFSLSFACFIFFFIGAPLGAIIRKGGLGMPVVVSVLLFIIYYIISMMGERSAREAVISPAFGMWISAFILLPLGAILTYKSVTDSEMMNTEAYHKFFDKILHFFKKKVSKGQLQKN